MSSTVSVLLPTYEPDPAFLTLAIESVLTQTHQDWTLFIHDDASKADVEAMVKPFLADSRIQFRRGGRNRGIGGNWNACLKEADGDFVQFLFQDDVWVPAYLETAVASLVQHPRAGLISVNHAYASEAGAETFFRSGGFAELAALKQERLKPGLQESIPFLHWWMARGLRPNLIGEPSFVMLRRSVTDRVGLFREDLPQGLDLEYWIRMLLAADWAYIPQELGAFRVHKGGASMRNDTMGAGLFDRLACFEPLLIHSRTAAAAQAGVRQSLAGMRDRFRTRVATGGRVGGGKGKLIAFALRHPFLVLAGLFGKRERNSGN